ncbi:hypothetical protein B0H14DRAFT_2973743, partial [Mycena olivaceomarginata]
MLHFRPAGLLRLRQYSSPAALEGASKQKRNRAHHEVFKHWYTPPDDLLPPDWAGTRMWVSKANPKRPLAVGLGGLGWHPPDWLMKGNSIREVEARFNGPFRLPAPIEPLVYWDEDGLRGLRLRLLLLRRRKRGAASISWDMASSAAFLRARMNSFVEVAPVSERGHLYTELFPEQE